MDAPEIDTEKSFLQNIMLLAARRGVTAKRVSEVSGVSRPQLVMERLKERPYANFALMSESQAEAAIELVAPERAPSLRTLKGYPEPYIDNRRRRL